VANEVIREEDDGAEDAQVSGQIHLNADFRVLWLSRTVGQIGHQTAAFGSLIVVTEATGSGLWASLLVLAWVLPNAIFSVVSGSVVDALSKQLVLTVANGVRAGACFVFVLSTQDTEQVFVLVVVLAAVGPFVGLAESALVPTLVRRESLTSANAFLNFMRYVAQVAGLAVLAPVLTQTAGAELLFVVTGVLFGVAAIYAALIPMGALHLIPRGEEPLFPDDAARPRRGGIGSARAYLRAHRDVWQAAVENSLISATLPLLAALIPVYLVEVLDQRVSDLPVIFVPGIVGMLAGLRLVSGLARRWDPAWLATVGMGLFAAGLLALAAIDAVDAGFSAIFGFRDMDLGVMEISAASLAAMVLLFPMGFAFALVNVATTAIINERVPVSMQGRVFALMMLMTGIAALPPLLAGGGLTEVVDVRVVLGLSPLLLVVAWGWAQWGGTPPGGTHPGDPGPGSGWRGVFVGRWRRGGSGGRA